MNKAEKHFSKVAPPHMALLMRDFPFDLDEAAAVFGNAGYESGGFLSMQEIEPLIPGSAGGFGWFQWTGPRRRDFEAYCRRNDLDPRSDEANYKFLFVELTTTSERKAVSAVVGAEKTENLTRLKAKTKAFELAYERAGKKNYASRYKWAALAKRSYKDMEAQLGRVPFPAWYKGSVTAPEKEKDTRRVKMRGGVLEWVLAVLGIGAVVAAFLFL